MNDESKPESYPRITRQARAHVGWDSQIIPAVRATDEPEKPQISIEGADHLYRDIRLENALEDETGKTLRLKAGAQADVTVEADPPATKPSSENSGR
jgi:hypothetical protein